MIEVPAVVRKHKNISSGEATAASTRTSSGEATAVVTHKG